MQRTRPQLLATAAQMIGFLQQMTAEGALTAEGEDALLQSAQDLVTKAATRAAAPSRTGAADIAGRRPALSGLLHNQDTAKCRCIAESAQDSCATGP